MKQLVVAAFCLLNSAFLPGCVFPYVYPKLEYTPRLSIDSPPDEVHLFRVDSTHAKLDVGESIDERYSTLAITNPETIPPQIQTSVTRGFYVFGVALNYTVESRRTVALRLYRPGYEVVQVTASQDVDRIAWKPANSQTDQEKAIDALFPVGKIHQAKGWSTWRSGSLEGMLFHTSRALEPASRVAHFEALRFGASEYERLARAADSRVDQERLELKAKKLRDITRMQ